MMITKEQKEQARAAFRLAGEEVELHGEIISDDPERKTVMMAAMDYGKPFGVTWQHLQAVMNEFPELKELHDKQALRNCNRWRMEIELTFDQLPEDVKDRQPSDTAKDFSDRALYRVKKDLDALLKNSQFAHYHIKVLPNGCHEFD